jgi:hypothetical protein
MIHRTLLTASAVIASLFSMGCSDTTVPDQAEPGSVSFARSGMLRVTKKCDQTYHGLANDFCIITSSTLKEIEVGSTITYLSAASPAFFLESDVVLDLPHPGNNVAYGHCSVDLTRIDGTMGCVFSGGTGKFKWFHADVKLSLLDPEEENTELVWNGTYSFSPHD